MSIVERFVCVKPCVVRFAIAYVYTRWIIIFIQNNFFFRQRLRGAKKIEMK